MKHCPNNIMKNCFNFIDKENIKVKSPSEGIGYAYKWYQVLFMNLDLCSIIPLWYSCNITESVMRQNYSVQLTLELFIYKPSVICDREDESYLKRKIMTSLKRKNALKTRTKKSTIFKAKFYFSLRILFQSSVNCNCRY